MSIPFEVERNVHSERSSKDWEDLGFKPQISSH